MWLTVLDAHVRVLRKDGAEEGGVLHGDRVLHFVAVDALPPDARYVEEETTAGQEFEPLQVRSLGTCAPPLQVTSLVFTPFGMYYAAHVQNTPRSGNHPIKRIKPIKFNTRVQKAGHWQKRRTNQPPDAVAVEEHSKGTC